MVQGIDRRNFIRSGLALLLATVVAPSRAVADLLKVVNEDFFQSEKELVEAYYKEETGPALARLAELSEGKVSYSCVEDLCGDRYALNIEIKGIEQNEAFGRATGASLTNNPNKLASVSLKIICREQGELTEASVAVLLKDHLGWKEITPKSLFDYMEQEAGKLGEGRSLLREEEPRPCPPLSRNKAAMPRRDFLA